MNRISGWFGLPRIYPKMAKDGCIVPRLLPNGCFPQWSVVPCRPEPAMPWVSCNLCSPAAPPHGCHTKPWLSQKNRAHVPRLFLHPSRVQTLFVKGLLFWILLKALSAVLDVYVLWWVFPSHCKQPKWLVADKLATIQYFQLLLCPDSSLVLAKLFREVRLKRRGCSWHLQWVACA